MVEEGIVSQVKGSKIVVNIARKSACETCRLCRKSEEKLMQVELENSSNARVGDKVRLHIKDGFILKVSILTYILPLVFLFIGLFIGNLINEITGAAFGITFLILSFFIIRKRGRKYEKNISYSIIGGSSGSNSNSSV